MRYSYAPLFLCLVPATTLCSIAPASASPFLRSSANAAVRHVSGSRGKIGPILTTAHGGLMVGWDVDQNGNDGLLAEADQNVSILESFDLATAKITSLGSRQPAHQGNAIRQYFVEKILANDVALVDDDFLIMKTFTRNDTFPLVSPAKGAKITGEWTPPHRHNLLVQWVADNQTTTQDAVVADTNKPTGGVIHLLLSDVAKNTFGPTTHFPTHPGQVWGGPQLVALDTSTNHAVVGTQLDIGSIFNPFESPSFGVFDVNTGSVLSVYSPNVGSGAIMGIAIDSKTHMMCTTTSTDSNVEFYNLTTGAAFAVPFPGLHGQLNSGGAVAVDQLHHLFIVTQPSVGSFNSTVFVYAENGNLLESIPGFSFSNTFAAIFAYVAVNPKMRIGYATGPNENQIQQFTY
ncbi:MAG: hypothetical protein JO060_04925 [Candidatus Eremiobacteraeota bacterium]|nr:hypothetical protein [Candidatus Eremiobacteraeota bacterium]